MPPVSHGNTPRSMAPNLLRHPFESFPCPWNQNVAVVYFYSATSRRLRGAMWSIFTPALIGVWRSGKCSLLSTSPCALFLLISHASGAGGLYASEECGLRVL